MDTFETYHGAQGNGHKSASTLLQKSLPVTGSKGPLMTGKAPITSLVFVTSDRRLRVLVTSIRLLVAVILSCLSLHSFLGRAF
jgi:hypothetical protein